MAKNKSSKFDLNNGLFGSVTDSDVTQKEHEVQQEQDVQIAPPTAVRQPDLADMYSPPAGPTRYGTTQGRKGSRLKRINMAFGDEVHAYITFESRRRGISATQFVNGIITEYMNSPEGHID